MIKTIINGFMELYTTLNIFCVIRERFTQKQVYETGEKVNKMDAGDFWAKVKNWFACPPANV